MCTIPSVIILACPNIPVEILAQVFFFTVMHLRVILIMKFFLCFIYLAFVSSLTMYPGDRMRIVLLNSIGFIVFPRSLRWDKY